MGRFSYDNGYGKGYDVLLHAMAKCPKEYMLYIIGGIPTKEFVQMKQSMNIQNVEFIGFKTKEELKEYYKAADLFCLQTRGDVWGLVVNEAMACGLPVITSNRCGAGLELVHDDKNGFIVPTEDDHELSIRIKMICEDIKKSRKMGEYSIELIENYTIEDMMQAHIRILQGELKEK